MTLNEEKLNGLFNRVLNSAKTTEQDELDIKEYIGKVFGQGHTPSLHEMHQFNNLVVKKADEIARPKATEILELLADYVKLGSVQAYQYDIPQKHKAKVVWSANGTSVDHVRVEGKSSKVATPTKLSTGFYYEPLSLVQGDVEMFRNLVSDVADAKIRLYFQTISKLLQTAITAGDVPAGNVKVGSNITLTEYNAIASKLQRYGGRPVFIADTSFIDKIAFQQVTDTTFKSLITDDIRSELANDLNVARIGRTVAVSLVNPFVAGSGNTVTELPVDEGFMFAGGVREKAFKVIEFGGLTQYTTFDPNLERIEMKITQECAFEFVQGEAVGYLQDDSIQA
ncbi:major capsid protein [Psychrobacillus phage Perkons]|nr:major capsid protein [Psychrobacillus phage Perkons]